MKKEIKQENIIKAMKWLTERIAELQCRKFPWKILDENDKTDKWVERNKKDKWKRIEKILKSNN